MKQVHNIRIRVHNPSRETVDAVLARVASMTRKTEDEPITTTITEEDGLVIGEAWLDRQQPVRRFLKALLETMTPADKQRIHDNPTRYLDTGTHCFFHLSLDSFVAKEPVLIDKPIKTVNIRLNIACWPAHKENAIKTMQELFV